MQLEKLFKEREKVLRELEHAEAVLEHSKKDEDAEEVRPMHKTGFMGCVGPKVDTIDFLENRSAHLTNEFEEERKHVLQTEKSNTAFVIFNNRRSAAQASQVSSSSLHLFDHNIRCTTLECGINLAFVSCCRLCMHFITRIGP